MPYVFPKRSLKDGDVLDPQELNEDFIASADLYSGRLDQHNFVTAISPTVAKDAFYETLYAYREVEIDWGDASGGFVSQPYDTDALATGYGAKAIPNDGSWDTLAFNAGDFDTNNMMTVTSGASVLWINAQVQYFWRGWGGTNRHVFSQPFSAVYASGTSDNSTPARVQFAIRINGNIIASTVTGKEMPYDRAVIPAVVTIQKTYSAFNPMDPGPGPQQQYCYDTSALGPEIYPVRISAVVPMPAGTHTVEIVCRRLAVTDRVQPYGVSGGSGEGDFVYATNRQLGVTILPTYAASATTFDSVSVESFESEDTFSSVTIAAERLDVIRDKYNAVKAGALARGSLNHLQLPSMIGSNTQQKTIARSVAPYFASSANKYPGWSSNDTTTSPTGDGWRLIQDSASDELKTGSFTVSEASYLLVFVNLGLVRMEQQGTGFLYDASASETTYYVSPAQWCAFRIGVFENGDSLPVMLKRTEAAVNKFNLAGDFQKTGGEGAHGTSPIASALVQEAMNQAREQANIPLLAIIDVDSGGDYAVGTTFDYIGAYGAVMNDAGYEYTIQNSSIDMIQIKKGS